MTKNLPVTKTVVELSLCQCKTVCAQRRCVCKKNNLLCTEMCLCVYHCVKGDSVSLRIQSECGKMGTRITPNTDTFHAVYCTNEKRDGKN